MNTEKVLSTGQTAKYLGVTVRTIYRWEDAGRLHSIRLPTGMRCVAVFAARVDGNRAQAFRRQVRQAARQVGKEASRHG